MPATCLAQLRLGTDLNRIGYSDAEDDRGPLPVNRVRVLPAAVRRLNFRNVSIRNQKMKLTKFH